MPPTNYPNGVTSFGILQLGGGSIPSTTGNVRFVSSTRAGASNSNNGQDPDHAWSTMVYAAARMKASQGDMVIVLPGHVETVIAAAGFVHSVAGVTWIGLGYGSLKPKVNFTTAVGADMDVDAANTVMVNFQFTGGFDALTGPIDINAAGCKLIDILTKDVTGQATDFIVADANADDLVISGWRHEGAAAAGAESALQLVGGDNATIEDFWIDGNFGTAAIENVTTASVNTTIGGGPGQNYIRTRNAADVAVTMVATSTGNIGPNINIRVADNAANVTEALVGADMQFFQPLPICNADGEVGLNTNITATVDEA